MSSRGRGQVRRTDALWWLCPCALMGLIAIAVVVAGATAHCAFLRQDYQEARHPAPPAKFPAAAGPARDGDERARVRIEFGQHDLLRRGGRARQRHGGPNPRAQFSISASAHSTTFRRRRRSQVSARVPALHRRNRHGPPLVTVPLAFTRTGDGWTESLLYP